MDDELLGAFEIFGGLMGAALGGVGAVAGAAVSVTDGAQRMLYSKLQEGKKNLHDKGVANGWDDAKKREANKQYKAEFTWLHKSGSTDVFPEVS